MDYCFCLMRWFGGVCPGMLSYVILLTMNKRGGTIVSLLWDVFSSLVGVGVHGPC